MQRVLWASVALASLGCASAPTLEADREVYRPGDDVALTLTAGARSLEYNLCVARLLGENGEPAGEQRDQWCPLKSLELAAGAVTTGPRRLSESIAPGRYSLGLEVAEEGHERVSLRSGSFVVSDE